jgi:pSer/pThr/pTyr-binding forkhead associated (FHA) protein
MSKLICISGMNKGHEYKLPENGEVTLGRSEKNDICVFDKKSSRQHCRIYVKGDSIEVEDLKSTNGLKVNDDFITGKRPIKQGDRVGIGQTEFLLSGDSFSDDESEEKKDKKYENLLQQTAFQATKTTALRKMKTEEDGRNTGFLSFFEVNEKKEKE